MSCHRPITSQCICGPACSMQASCPVPPLTRSASPRTGPGSVAAVLTLKIRCTSTSGSSGAARVTSFMLVCQDNAVRRSKNGFPRQNPTLERGNVMAEGQQHSFLSGAIGARIRWHGAKQAWPPCSLARHPAGHMKRCPRSSAGTNNALCIVCQPVLLGASRVCRGGLHGNAPPACGVAPKEQSYTQLRADVCEIDRVAELEYVLENY
jgi:hypothetical protein